MKIVFDTNVLISAFLSSGGMSQAVFNEAIQGHKVILSEYVLEEFQRILQRKFNVPKHKVDFAIHAFRQNVLVLDKVPLAGVHFPDKADIPILALAKASRAQVLVTGDKKLLELKRFFKAAVVSPREAMEIL